MCCEVTCLSKPSKITLATLEEGVLQEIKMSHYSVAVGLSYVMGICFSFHMQLANTSQITVLEIVFWVTYNLNLNVVPIRVTCIKCKTKFVVALNVDVFLVHFC